MNNIIKYASNKTECFRLNAAKLEETELQIKNNQICQCLNKTINFIAATVWVNGRMGVFTSNKPDKKLIDNAIKVAKANKKQEYFYGLPENKKPSRKKLYDDNLKKIDEDKLVEYAKRLINNSVEKNIKLSEGGVSLTKEYRRAINSNGFDSEEESYSMSLYGATVAKNNGKDASYWDSIEMSRAVDVEKFANNLRMKTKDSLNAVLLKKKYDVVAFMPAVFATLLSRGLLENFNGKNAEKKKSIFSGKIGTRVFGDSITIEDNAQLANGINSTAFDDEGTLSKNTKLIDKGMLCGFVYDYNTALHNGQKSTGNSFQNAIDFTNVLIKGHPCEMNKGLLADVVIGAHTSNPTTTEFSIKMELGYVFEKGEVKPVRDCMLYGKLSELLNNVEGFFGNEEQHEGIYTKKIAARGVKIN